MSIEELDPDEFLEAIRINREFDKDENIPLFSVADYHTLLNRKYTKKSGKEIKHDETKARDGRQKSLKIRATMTGEILEEKKGGLLNSFMAITGAKIEVIREIKTDEAWEEFLKSEENK